MCPCWFVRARGCECSLSYQLPGSDSRVCAQCGAHYSSTEGDARQWCGDAAEGGRWVNATSYSLVSVSSRTRRLNSRTGWAGCGGDSRMPRLWLVVVTALCGSAVAQVDPLPPSCTGTLTGVFTDGAKRVLSVVAPCGGAPVSAVPPPCIFNAHTCRPSDAYRYLPGPCCAVRALRIRTRNRVQHALRMAKTGRSRTRRSTVQRRPGRARPATTPK